MVLDDQARDRQDVFMLEQRDRALGLQSLCMSAILALQLASSSLAVLVLVLHLV